MYLATAWDLLMLTMVLLIADGARSPLTVGYFLVIGLAALRFSLPLIRFATVVAISGYFYVAHYPLQNVALAPLPFYTSYFSLEQCLWLDAYRQAIEDLPADHLGRATALSCLLHAAAYCPRRRDAQQDERTLVAPAHIDACHELCPVCGACPKPLTISAAECCLEFGPARYHGAHR